MIMDDIPEELWSFSVPSSYCFQNNETSSSTLKMKLSNNTSELDFQRFLQEFSIDPDSYASKPYSSIDNQNIDVQCHSSSTKNGGNDKEASILTLQNHLFDQHNNKERSSYTLPIVDPTEYQTYLKQRLDMACEKIKALIPKNSERPKQSTSTTHEPYQNLIPQSSMEIPTEFDLLSNVQGNNKDGLSGGQQGYNIFSFPLQSVEKFSLDDGLKNNYYSDAKRMRRLVQNRESARRSRKKKQVQENEIENQVTELKAEQDSKTKLAIELTQRFSEELINNRLFQAKIEILKEKVKMAEDTLKRVNPSSLYTTMEKQKNELLSLVAYKNDPSFVLLKHDLSSNHIFYPHQILMIQNQTKTP